MSQRVSVARKGGPAIDRPGSAISHGWGPRAHAEGGPPESMRWGP